MGNNIKIKFKKSIKGIVILLLIIGIVILAVSCTLISNLGSFFSNDTSSKLDSWEKYNEKIKQGEPAPAGYVLKMYPYKKAIGKDMLEKFKNKDYKGIADKFCPYVKENYDIESELSVLKDAIPGNIVEYGETEVDWSQEYSEGGKIRYLSTNVSLKGIKNDNGLEYEVTFYGTSVDEGHPEWIGLLGIIVNEIFPNYKGYKELLYLDYSEPISEE